MTCPVLSASPGACARAAKELGAGGLVIVPTDTVYGIAADIRHDDAVTRINEVKGRPGVPLQLLFGPEPAELARYAVVDGDARRLVDALGPGGWTLIVPARPGWSSPALAGGTTVGIRIPDASVVHDVVRQLGAPVAASSANRHGDPSPAICAEAVGSTGDACVLALDGGPAPEGLDSTVVDLASDPPVILREGAIDRDTIVSILGRTSIEVRRSVRPGQQPHREPQP